MRIVQYPPTKEEAQQIRLYEELEQIAYKRSPETIRTFNRDIRYLEDLRERAGKLPGEFRETETMMSDLEEAIILAQAKKVIEAAKGNGKKEILT